MITRNACSVLAMALLLTGCGGGEPTYDLHQVTGTVKYTDGSVPAGEVAEVSFEPEPATPKTKRATGKIKPDGTFILQTIKPADGAFAGDYKVVVTVYKTYVGREALVAEKFLTAKDSPLKVTVKPGEKNEFPITVDKK